MHNPRASISCPGCPLLGGRIELGEFSAGFLLTLTSPFEFDSIFVRLNIVEPDAPPCFQGAPVCTEVFNGVFAPEDVGSVFFVNADTNATFPEIQLLLTNGLDDDFLVSAAPYPVDNAGGGRGIPESALFFNGGGPDFVGQQVTGLQFTLLDVYIFPRWAAASFRVDVLGPNAPDVPEPSTTLLFGSGLVAAFIGFRSRNRPH